MKYWKPVLPCLLGCLCVFLLSCERSEQRLSLFSLNDVRLHDSLFLRAQQVDGQYILEMDADRLLAPYLLDADVIPKANPYGNWENTGLDGHIGGHYLSALSFMYASSGEDIYLQRLNYMIDELGKCQQKNGNGYLGGVPGGKKLWREIAQGDIRAGSFSLNDKWVPLYNIHKVFAGLRDAYQVAGVQKAREMLVKLSDWFIHVNTHLSEAQIQEMLRSEYGGLNEVLADVSEITGEKKYLDLAKKYSHQLLLRPLSKGEDKLTGMHANTQIPKVIGFQRVGELVDSAMWHDAAQFFWETVTKNRTVSIGGNSVREHFNPVDNFSALIQSNQGPETCNTYNMLRLTQKLFVNDPQGYYMDFYEQGLYNHILSSQHPEGGFVYFTPMRPRHYRVYSQPHEAFWCCVGSGIENHGKYGEMIYAKSKSELYVNLFIASTVKWKARGLTLSQETKFPFEEQTKLMMQLEKATKFNLKLRIPSWLKSANIEVLVNDKPEKVKIADGYAGIERAWSDGDQIVLKLPMKTQVKSLPDSSDWRSIMHGPVVMAAVTDTTDLEGLWADGARMAHVASGQSYPIDEAPILVAEDDEQIIKGLEQVEGENLAFRLPNLIRQDEYKSLKLVPFFNIHEARYMIYWPVYDAETMEAKVMEIREAEKAALALEAITVDQVAPGEQQSESDHFIKSQNSESGLYGEKHWRHARDGWFSYALKDAHKEGEKLRVTYWGKDNGRQFDILVNGTPVGSEHLDGSKGEAFYQVDYPLPSSVQKSSRGTLRVRFQAQEGSTAGGVYYLRLVK